MLSFSRHQKRVGPWLLFIKTALIVSFTHILFMKKRIGRGLKPLHLLFDTTQFLSWLSICMHYIMLDQETSCDKYPLFKHTLLKVYIVLFVVVCYLSECATSYVFLCRNICMQC